MVAEVKRGKVMMKFYCLFFYLVQLELINYSLSFSTYKSTQGTLLRTITSEVERGTFMAAEVGWGQLMAAEAERDQSMASNKLGSVDGGGGRRAKSLSIPEIQVFGQGFSNGDAELAFEVSSRSAAPNRPGIGINVSSNTKVVIRFIYISPI